MNFPEKVKQVIHYKENGLGNKEIAKKLSIAEASVKKLWALRRLHPLFMQLLESGNLSKERAEKLARLPPEKQEEEYRKMVGAVTAVTETSDEETVRKLILEGVLGVNLGRTILGMPGDKRKKALDFLADPAGKEPPSGLNDEIQEKRRELVMLDREINYKKNSITFMNYTRDALKPLVKAEDTIRELARGGVDRAFLIELTEWLSLLRRVSGIINDATAIVQVYDAVEVALEKKKGSNALCQ